MQDPAPIGFCGTIGKLKTKKPQYRIGAREGGGEDLFNVASFNSYYYSYGIIVIFGIMLITVITPG